MTMAADKQDKVLNVPTLRFPEFNGEWVKYRVSDVLDFYSTNSLSWDQLEYNTDELQNLHYGLIHVGLPTVVNLDENVLPNIKKEFLPKNYELCREGDVAFADASEDTNEVAKAIEFVNLSDKNVVCGLHTIHGRDNHNLTSIGFKGYSFASESFHNQIRRIAQGTKIFSISSKNFNECYMGIPSKDEQTKIAKLLALIDERISTQSRIIEDLKQLRSALYYQIFSNIQGNWVTLKMVGDIAKGKQINGSELLDEGMYYVMNGGITPSGYYNNYNTPANTISISEGGNSCGYVQYNSVPFWSGGHCYNLRIKKSFDSQYIFHFLKFKELDIMALRIGSGLPNIQKKDLEHFQVLVPDFTTQKKVTGLFVLINKKEETEMKLMNAWKMQKKYLLQKLFI